MKTPSTNVSTPYRIIQVAAVPRFAGVLARSPEGQFIVERTCIGCEVRFVHRYDSDGETVLELCQGCVSQLMELGEVRIRQHPYEPELFCAPWVVEQLMIGRGGLPIFWRSMTIEPFATESAARRWLLGE